MGNYVDLSWAQLVTSGRPHVSVRSWSVIWNLVDLGWPQMKKTKFIYIRNVKTYSKLFFLVYLSQSDNNCSEHSLNRLKKCSGEGQFAAYFIC